MILYFSGTGNTRFVAKSLANLLEEETGFLPDTEAEKLESVSGEALIFVFPIYSWGVPPFILDYIRDIPQNTVDTLKKEGKEVMMVCTCGDETGEAPEMFIEAWRKRGVEVKGIWRVIMPNNYVLLPGFNVDSQETEQRKLDEAPARVREVAAEIKSGNLRINVTKGSWPRLKSRLIYPLFKKWGMNPKRWQVSQECVKCGRCVSVCPVGNVRMKTGKPHWSSACVSCTACYHHCPGNAISYGNITKEKGQYFCHLLPIR